MLFAEILLRPSRASSRLTNDGHTTNKISKYRKSQYALCVIYRHFNQYYLFDITSIASVQYRYCIVLIGH